MTDLKLGRKPGVVVDRRTLTIDRIMHAAVIGPPPPSFDVAAKLTSFPMFANDSYGDCTCAAHGHRVVAEERSSGQRELQLTDKDILTVYSAVTGFNPKNPDTDNGAYCLDVLNYMRRKGMGRERDGTPHTIGAFASVRMTDHVQTKTALRLFGGLYIGAALPNSASEEINAGLPWTKTTDNPGGWGGHCMYVRGYSVKGVHLVTWGGVQNASWTWWDRYVDESYAVITEDYLRGSKTPQGFDVAQLRSYLGTLH